MMHHKKKLEEYARMLGSRAILDVTLGEDDSGLSNIGTSLILDANTRLAVYWLGAKDQQTIEEQLNHLLDHGQKLVIATPILSARLATQWRKQGLQYMDAAGNACINTAGYHIVSVGHQSSSSKPVTKSVEGKTGKSFQPSGLKVIFSLLTNEALVSSSLRVISEQAGVSLGSASSVYKDLLAHGYIRKQGQQAELRNKKQLIARWAEAYPYLIRNKKLIGHFTSDDPSWWKKVEGLSGFQFGGEIAAHKLSNYLSPKEGLVYLDKEYLNQENLADFMRTARLRKLKEEEKPAIVIDLFESFWQQDVGETTAPTLVVYSDLMATNDPRNIDSATRIYDEFFD